MSRLMSLSGGKADMPRTPTEKSRSLRVDRDRKLFDGPQARPPPPANRVRRHGQLQVRPALEERLQRALGLNAGELVAQAEMDARAERQVAVGSSLKIELIRARVGIRIHVGCR